MKLRRRFGRTTWAVLLGALVVLTAGCGLDMCQGACPEDDDDAIDDSTEAAETTAGEDVPIEGYLGVLIADAWTDGDGCPSAAEGAEGAQIDAVALFDANGNLLAYANTVVSSVPASTSCGVNKFPNAAAAQASPDASQNSGFVALSGGAIAVEFGAGAPALTNGQQIQVFEVDAGYCATCPARSYAVSVVQRADCLRGGVCSPIKQGSAVGGATLIVTGL